MDLALITTILVRVLGLLAAVAAIFTTRTAQGATAWAIALVAYPYVSLPLYMVFGLDRFEGYVRARRLDDKKLRRQLEETSRKIRAQGSLDAVSRDRLGVFEKLAGFPFTSDNQTTLLVDGQATFNAIIQDITQAQSYILIQFYIVRDDDLGRRLLEALVAAARRGVRVCFLYDAIGSHGLTRAFRDTLDQAGIAHGAFRSTRSPRSRIQANFRNHRKLVVVDGRTACIGGHNVGNEYLGLNPSLGAWRDTHVRLKGSVALQAQLTFLEDWFWTKNEIPTSLSWEVPVTSPGEAYALTLPTGPVDSMNTCATMFAHAIGMARERFWFTTPYFIPDPALMSAIQLARLRNVDVRLIVTKKSDNLLSDLASSTYLPEALAVGARVFRYADGFMHQKVFVIDQDVAAIGTANFDIRSFRLNFEISAIIKDDALAGATAAMLDHDMARSEEIRLEDFENIPFSKRLMARMARLMTPVM